MPRGVSAAVAKQFDGSGYGYGSGYGDGSGYGYGYGSGSGYGYGYGYGSGSGYGDGSGSGYGDGSGYGSGYGYGDGSYWRAAVKAYAARWAQAQRERMRVLKSHGATIAYWNSDADGRPANGGRGERVYAGLVQHESGPLVLCERGTLHATLLPPRWQGSRRWIVALLGTVVGNDEKYGALTREILGEALPPAAT